ncbi:retrovirus-related Pol polyprotein from type-1 retrotransposable element R2 [Elysia marginata]|uniref:Retrovirus-related Pol polyprotein from type-1 retrotransposable element R2 n=1 Tax=Elysia marginata TaxID=1093978 RepID=A0AAV4H1C9_9GAST|nr:retrovirus-related Pol polyprotein from type-1 retrotransposable element R2 [Elysia marginata]
MYITFIDYSKAFDSVKHNHLFKTMDLMRFPKHLIKLIAGQYFDQRAYIRWDDKKCEFFNITKGVRQGCILSPHLFNICTEQIMREADIDQSGVNINARNLTHLRYADDTALMSDNITSMRRILHRVDESF